jgi:quinol monooxygenase YgiN
MELVTDLKVKAEMPKSPRSARAIFCLGFVCAGVMATVFNAAIAGESSTRTSVQVSQVPRTDKNSLDEKTPNAKIANEESLPLVIITHVDAMPPFTAKATELLNKYRDSTLKESGNKRVDILQQVGRPNHFTIVEEWRDQNAFKDHESAAGSRKFRAELQDALGAPFDERPHHILGN